MPEPTPFPGFEEPTHPAGDVERAARRTLVELADVLEDHPHLAVMAQTLVTLGRQIDRATNSTKAKEYAVANLAGQLRDTYLVITDVEGGNHDDPWSALERDLATRSRTDLPHAEKP